ncbi:MAG: M55 family metallopeptidase [bacterium]
MWTHSLPVTVAAALLLASPGIHAQSSAEAPEQPTPAEGRQLRVFLSVDMEGATGVVTPEQLGPEGFEYARFREFVTEEALAAMEGAREAGATEFVVADAHGNGQNLLIERFPDDVEIVRSWPRPLHMVQGIDESFDAAFFIGYHAAATNTEGVRAHTFSSANYSSVVLNGVPLSEGGMNAAIAGHFGVPVALVTGDDVTVAEMEDLLGDVEGVAVKQALGFHSARTLTPAAARERIRQGARRALERVGDFRPYEVDGEPVLELTFKSYRPAEVLAYLPIVERPSDRTIRYRGADMVEISKFLQFVGHYRSDLSP